MSKRTRANFEAVERLREEKRKLECKINWLLTEIHYIKDNPSKEWAMCGYCPSNCSDMGCEFTIYDGVNDRPQCSWCWREHMERAV